MPNGVTEASSAAQLKAAAKEWGLPVTGSKPVLWQRLLDQVQDSVEQEEEDEKPNLCLVSGATRAELTGYRQQRISQSKAKVGMPRWACQPERFRRLHRLLLRMTCALFLMVNAVVFVHPPLPTECV